jgi:putative addiction module component (TIGR02574 family)
MAAVTEIMQDVLKLPRTERSFLAKKLLESLEADESFSAEEMEVFQSRSREIREGRVKPMTLEQLQQDVSARMA